MKQPAEPDETGTTPAPRLQHEYVAGLRFERTPCHAVQTRRGIRWAELPWPPSGSRLEASSGNGYAVSHCLSLLGRVKVSPNPTRSNDLDTSHWALSDGQCLVATTHRARSQQQVGAIVHEVILRGDVCLLEVQMAGEQKSRNVRRAVSRLLTITGVEVTLSSTATRICTLLLLDPADLQPWASGHNARLTLSKASSAPQLIRYETGHLAQSEVKALIEWRRRPG